ncbi:hypothetical protein HL658_29185 [Azospirillum sp. RWY-5-1]|uniref:Uncharacterized protein n=1 Tax=Azospirillum oleiclasticum TaxID=2735135 RepID=A0ABX2TLA9_9PROT|nr:hypothetical protein [Azospirillum oleiclasticum]NYZ16639.1 hypothetical protein [Azospirillum oleiclasticum]NYZ24126.1 hypothetical protein [Azospirillum oleiclasticum]
MAEPHVVSALRDKHAEIQGRIREAECELARLRDDLSAVARALIVFDPDFDLRTVRPKRPARRGKWFGPGECARFCYDILRPATAPVTTREIVERAMVAKGLDPADSRTRECVQKTILGTLNKLGEVERLTLDGGAAAWEVR